MTLRNKIIIIGLIGGIQLTHASSTAIKVENKAEAISIQIENEMEGVKDTVTLQKEGNQLAPTPGEVYAAVSIDGSNQQRIKIQYLDPLLELVPNGDLLLSGEYQKALMLSYNGSAKVEKGKTLTLKSACLLQGLSQFENAGTMHLVSDLTTIITAFSNQGELHIERGWQDTALKRFENGATGKIVLQRADIMSPSVSFSNKGIIACVADWNGAGCSIDNVEGAQFNVGGNCTLKQLSNYSQMEPQLKNGGKLEHVSTIYRDINGQTMPSIDESSERRAGTQHGHVNCKRIITQSQTFTRREGARSQVYVGKTLNLNAGNSFNKCSELFIGQDFAVKGGQFQSIGWSVSRTEQTSAWVKVGEHAGCKRGIKRNRHFYWDFGYKH